MSQAYFSTQPTLTQLGWKNYFQQQVTLEEWEQFTPVRIFAQTRSTLYVISAEEQFTLPMTPSYPDLTVGDWLLLDTEKKFSRLLDRTSLFSRKAAGSRVTTQLLAANIDTVFIVSSLNQDFNLNRIERYLALAKDAGVESVVVLTKSDTCDNPQDFVAEVQRLDPLLVAVAVNGLDTDSVTALAPWCSEGKTIVFLGSSGVGKSTLVNRLLGTEQQATGEMREDDAKGRHTTTGRSLHLLPQGGLLLDTPGIRELQLTDCESGIEEAFAEITDLTTRCRFSDCKHEKEPGCAILSALASGELDERRLTNYRKLMREQEFNTATMAEKRTKGRKFAKQLRSIQSVNPKNKDI